MTDERKSGEDALDERDVVALERVLELVGQFLARNPLAGRNVDLAPYQRQVAEVGALVSTGDPAARGKAKGIADGMKQLVLGQIHPEVYLVPGAHGGVIIGDEGFCEFDVPSFALDQLLARMNLAIATGMPLSLEVAASCLEWLHTRHPGPFGAFLEAFARGRFEIINPSYGQPYSLAIGEEANLKHFEFGLHALESLGLSCQTYWASECSLHPQIPQILRGFGLAHGSLRARLLGLCPTTPSGHVDWVGLDGTAVDAITDQGSVSNGELWHGTFFQELPSLLFQAVARPFMDRLVFSSLEDFVMPLPHQEDVWRVSRLGEVFGRFTTCSEFLDQTPRDGQFRFPRDAFFLGDYMFRPARLFLFNQRCEAALLAAEALNCVAGLFDIPSADTFLENAWKKLLLTQAHDCYAVPFVRSGDYSAHQLSPEEYRALGITRGERTIEETAHAVQLELLEACARFCRECLEKLGRDMGGVPEASNGAGDGRSALPSLVAFNPSLSPLPGTCAVPLEVIPVEYRPAVSAGQLLPVDEQGIPIPCEVRDAILHCAVCVPPLGVRVLPLREVDATGQPPSRFEVRLAGDGRQLVVSCLGEVAFSLAVVQRETPLALEQSHRALSNLGEVAAFRLAGDDPGDAGDVIRITQWAGMDRLDVVVTAGETGQLIVTPSFAARETRVNYPFGVEVTHRSRVQALDFAWLIGSDRGLLVLQRNSQLFHFDRDLDRHAGQADPEDVQPRTACIERARVVLHGPGPHELAFVVTHGKSRENALSSVMAHRDRFRNPLVGAVVSGHLASSRDSEQRTRPPGECRARVSSDGQDADPWTGSFLAVEPHACLANLWRRGDTRFLRVWNPGDSELRSRLVGPLAGQARRQVDLRGIPLGEEHAGEAGRAFRVPPWGIRTFELAHRAS